MYIRLLTFSTLAISLSAQPVAGAVPLQSDEAIQAHFKKRPPQLVRYQGMTTYGDSLDANRIDPVLLNEQLKLLSGLRDSPLLGKPTDPVIQLCHDLEINAPEQGLLLLGELVKAPLQKNQVDLFACCFLAGGSPGEALALRVAAGPDQAWARFSSSLLAAYAADEASIPTILEVIQSTKDTEVRRSLVRALSMIGSDRALKPVRDLLEKTSDDGFMADAIFTYTEVGGYEAIGTLKRLKPVGPKSKAELASSLEWLSKETSAKNPHGLEVEGDWSFVERFSDIRSPAMSWMSKSGLLNEDAFRKPRKLTESEMEQLLGQLIQSKAFGLEAAKGYLFHSLNQRHMPTLRQIMAVNWYSPNALTRGRAKTLNILLRHVRHLAQASLP